MTETSKPAQTGRLRQLSKEIEPLLKVRLQRYKRRTLKASMDGVAQALNDWVGIETWIPNAFAEGTPVTFTSDTLYRWTSFDKSRPTRPFVTPVEPRLTIIVEFLLAHGFLFEFELVSDERGFGLSKALQAFVGTSQQANTSSWSGEYTCLTEASDRVAMHRLVIFRDVVEDALLFEYNSAFTHARSRESRKRLEDRLTSNSLSVERTKYRGWGIITENNQAMSMMHRVSHTSYKPKPWVWEYTSRFNIYSIRLVLGPEDAGLSHEETLEDAAHSIILNKLTYDNDPAYSLYRKGGIDGITLRSIVRRMNEREIHQPLEALDAAFLEAAKRCDPDLIKQTLDEGANINAVDPKTGLTALLRAAYYGVGDLIDILSGYRSLDPSIRDKHGRLPSDLIAISLGDTEHFFPYVEKLIDLEVTYEEQHPPNGQDTPSAAPAPKP